MPSESAKDQANPGKKYRLQAQIEDRKREGHKISAGPTTVEAFENQPRSTPNSVTSRIRAGIFGFSAVEWVLAVAAAATFLLMAALIGQGNSLTSSGQVALIALLPLVAVTAILTWLDRWAPMETKYKILAVLWGAGVAAAAAAVVNANLFEDLLLTSGDYEYATLIAAVRIAPVGEELFKGVGVVAILLLARNRLFSPLSGLALAALVGAGFAYLENLEYFLMAMSEGSTVFGFTVVARAVLSPFIHPMATSFIGLGAANAILRRTGLWGWVWRLTLGFASAVSVHMLWNFLAAQGSQWLLWYVFLEIPLFILWLSSLIVWSGRQPKQIGLGLTPYVQTGWITPAEVRMVVDPAGRRYAKAWGKAVGAPAPKLVRRFMRLLGYLGLDQSLIANAKRPATQRIQNDRQYLTEALFLREEFVALEQIRGRKPPTRREGR